MWRALCVLIRREPRRVSPRTLHSRHLSLASVRMPLAVGPLGGVAFALVTYGGYRVVSFLYGMHTYRKTTKEAWVAAPPKFLRLDGDAPSRALRFFRINDEVMGGKSTSELELSDQGLLFTGTINTNGGGFCSCRTLGDDVPLGLSDGSSLHVDAAGDGMLYKVVLHTSDSWAMAVPSWSYDFIAAKRSTHRLPLSDFVPSSQGRVIKGKTLNAAEVTGIGFSLSLYTADGKPNPNFGDGPFRLEVRSVREVGGSSK